MNKFQREDLNFILNLDECGWYEFLSDSSAEDMIYALQLISTSLAEIDVEMMEIQEAMQSEIGLDCTQANEIINRVKKGVSK